MIQFSVVVKMERIMLSIPDTCYPVLSIMAGQQYTIVRTVESDCLANADKEIQCDWQSDAGHNDSYQLLAGMTHHLTGTMVTRPEGTLGPIINDNFIRTQDLSQMQTHSKF